MTYPKAPRARFGLILFAFLAFQMCVAIGSTLLFVWPWVLR